MLNIQNIACIFALTVLVFSKGTTGAENGESLLKTQDPYNFGNSNDTIVGPRYGIFWRIPGIYRPATTTTLPVCPATCCLTTCPAAAGVTCTAGTGGAPGTCSAGAVAGCRSMDTTCAATTCTLAATCMPPAAPAACTGPAGTAGSATVAPVC